MNSNNSPDSSLTNKLYRDRNQAIVTVDYIDKFVQEFDIEEQDVRELEGRAVLLNECKIKFNDVHSAITDIEGGLEVCSASQKTYFEFLNNFLRIEANIKYLMDKFTSNPAPVALTSTMPSLPQIKIPDVKLPCFSGGYSSWQSFKRLFYALVGDQTSINRVVKLQILLGHLQDTPYRMVEQVPLTEAGYLIALEILDKKYGNKRLQLNSHFQALYEIPKMKQESALELRSLIDNVLINIRALEALHQPIEHWSAWLVFHVSTRLDRETFKQWESKLDTYELPTWSQLSEFLDQRACLLEAIEEADSTYRSSGVTYAAVKSTEQKTFQPAYSKNRFAKTNSFLLPNSSSCQLCSSAEHLLYRCDQFLQMSAAQRLQQVHQLNSCINCLRPDHLLKDCRSNRFCRVCQGKHHTQLHYNFTGNNSPLNSPGLSANIISEQETSQNNSISENFCTLAAKQHQIMLSTAQIIIMTKEGQKVPARALLDSASQSNFMTEQLAQKLNLKRKIAPYSVGGLNNTQSQVKHQVTACIADMMSGFQVQSEFLIVPKITNNLPCKKIDISDWKIPSHIKLADPDFFESKRVDLLLGVSIFYELLENGKINLKIGLPTLLNTKIGWIVGGEVKNIQKSHQSLCHLVSNDDLQNQLQRFFEIEHIENKKHHTLEEEQCEESFLANTKRDLNGRFIVRLPVKEDSYKRLGCSRSAALKRFECLERKLVKYSVTKEPYVKFMEEYERLGHMTELKIPDDTIPHFYLPHHCVEKLESTTTKHRVVFDGSAKSSSGIALNDILMVGPVVQRELFEIALSFRKHPFAMTGDIEKMYRQCRVHDDDLPLQRILWRKHSSQPIKTFQLNTITYGTASASYLATRVLLQLANDEKHRFPLAAEVIHDFYMDDVLTGAETESQLITIQNELIQMLASSGMKLRKFCSNSSKILLNVLPADRELVLDSIHNISANQLIKALGLIWDPVSDCLEYKSEAAALETELTKRSILSAIGKLFDPLGLVSPVIIIAKVFMQRLWLLKSNWDCLLPQQEREYWRSFEKQLESLSQIKIPRLVVLPSAICYEIIGFSDSSEKAYGAVVYMRSKDQHNNVQVHLLCSKSRVAPLKTTTIPRLELCGALLLAQLTQKVLLSLKMKINVVHLASDSTITLAWIKTEPHRLNQFVANRVAKIQELTLDYLWHHIPTDLNPADLISRGVDATKLQEQRIWWHGPEFLVNSQMNWLSETSTNQELDLPELKSFALTIEVPKTTFIKNFSSLQKLKRITAYILRFKNNAQLAVNNRLAGSLDPVELNAALIQLIRLVQQEEFAVELKKLLRNKPIPESSQLKSLDTFLDLESKIIRVGGRLDNSSLSYAEKHPMLLPAKHHLTVLLFRDAHEKSMHAGPQALLQHMRTQFWPINGKSMSKQIVHQCVQCFRNKPRLSQQIMGQLPASRVTKSTPFVISSVDYAGPVLTKRRNQRNPIFEKSYVMVIVCCWSKAVHIEVISDLSSAACLAAIKRFISRRGKILEFYSDNATNFVGANNELLKLRKFMERADQASAMHQFCADQGISWKFAPARSPHFNGLCEAGVKSFKHHFKRVTSGAILTFEELSTLAAQIEACMNSRPLTPISDSPNDFIPLTPAHFLIGKPLNLISEPLILDIPINRLSKWQLVQQMQQMFWKRWSQEYLNTLQQRAKWHKNQPNLLPNDMVLVQDELTAPSCWPLGRVLQVHPGADHHVRLATIRTQKGVIQRAITKLCVLPKEA